MNCALYWILFCVIYFCFITFVCPGFGRTSFMRSCIDSPSNWYKLFLQLLLCCCCFFCYPIPSTSTVFFLRLFLSHTLHFYVCVLVFRHFVDYYMCCFTLFIIRSSFLPCRFHYSTILLLVIYMFPIVVVGVVVVVCIVNSPIL